MLGSQTQLPSTTGAVQVIPQGAGARETLEQVSAFAAAPTMAKAKVVAAVARILFIMADPFSNSETSE
jgi:hypothetical protein